MSQRKDLGSSAEQVELLPRRMEIPEHHDEKLSALNQR